MTSNPYSPPQTSPSLSRPITLATWRTVGFILLVGAVGALLGACVGGLLAWVTPDYYRQIFSAASNSGFQPMQIGVGLGCIQGLGGGIVLGTVLVITQAWLNLKRAAVDRQIGRTTGS